VNYNERLTKVTRLEEKGMITPEQAASLRTSPGENTEEAVIAPTGHKKLPLTAIALTLIAGA